MLIERDPVTDLTQIIEIATKSSEQAVFRGENQIFPTLMPSIGRLYCQWCESTNIKRSMEGFGEWEDKLYKQFVKRSEPFMPTIPESDETRALLIGQHYGLPTRLLDWSENVLIATFFAVEPNFSLQKTGQDEGDRKLFIYETDRVLEEITLVFSSKIKRIHRFYPPLIHQRIIAQSSLFTVHPRPYDNMLTWIKRAPKDKLTGFHIKGDHVKAIRDDLNKLGVNASTLGTDISGVVNYVKWQSLVHHSKTKGV